MGNPLLNLMGSGNNASFQQFMTFANMLKNGMSPQSVVEMIGQQNPQAAQAMQMLQGKTPQDMEKIMRNICAQKGINFDAAFAQFKQTIGK